MIRIQVPATSANLGSGFDSLGIALNLYNQIWMEEYDSVDISSKDDVEIPKDKSNLIYWAAEQLYSRCGRKLPGLKIVQLNNIPIARGLGSSSACIVAGISGANRLLGSPLNRQGLIDLAAEIEGHPDNTTPAIEGGLAASAIEAGRVYSVSVPVSEKIRFVLFIPPFELKTEKARSVLPKQYSREDAVYNLSRSALMTASLFSGRLENLRVAVQDRIHQPYRASLIDHLDDVFRMSYELGSLGTYVSGAGPTIISLVAANHADAFSARALVRLKEKDIVGWKIETLATDPDGARIFTE
ncbi:MAG: homoserine kinase [Oscillospiraceae bacterium]|jgi:homoserine kinase|nr:homoserine kinase [Oscillospiraceae bacterium]